MNNFYKSMEGNIDECIFDNARKKIDRLFDKENGGFEYRPKYPMSQYLLFLLNYHEMKSDESALKIVETTLEKMYKGGIFDHIGYGFFRYSVDEKWLVPQFEKILYDNALMSLVYSKAYEITKKAFYMNVAEKIYEFVIRDLLSEEGGFYSGLGNDEEGRDGGYYLFDYKEAVNLLGEEWGGLFNKYYDITKIGNFNDRNIPNLINLDLDNIDHGDFIILDSILQMIFTYREKRPMPQKDERILTSWNGLMIGSLAYAGKLYKNEFYIKKAKKSADFIISKYVDENGNLLSIYEEDKSYSDGSLEDYGFFIYGLIHLYKYNNDDYYLGLAKRLASDMLEIFGQELNMVHLPYLYSIIQLNNSL